MKQYRATFHPQAWQNDYAVPVDAEGPTTWDVTPEYLTGLLGTGTPNNWKLADVLEPDTYASDDLRFDPAAPQWVKDWGGPFYVEVE